MNCAVINCSNSTYKLKKNGSKKSVMDTTTLTVAVNKGTTFIVYQNSNYDISKHIEEWGVKK